MQVVGRERERERRFDADRVVVASGDDRGRAGQARYVLDLIEPLGG